MGCTRFLNLDADLRLDSEWNSDEYWEDVDPKTGKYSFKSKGHRRHATPFDDYDIIGMVFPFALDEMHNVGGGAVKYGFEFLFGIEDKRRTFAIPRGLMEEVNLYMKAWGKYTPKEFAREVRCFVYMDKWKMREAHECLVYHSIALLSIRHLREALNENREEDVCHAFKCFALAIHTIDRHTHEAPSEHDINFAEECLHEYVTTFHQEFKDGFMTYKNHCLIHLAGDARVFGAHLGSTSAYPFENFLSIFRRHLVKSGKNVLKQIENKLLGFSANRLPRNSLSGDLKDFSIPEEDHVEAMKRVGSTHLPSMTIIGTKDFSSPLKSVKCYSGVEITCK